MPDIRDSLLEELAYVRGCSREELDEDIKAGGGGLEIDSKEGQSVAIRMEMALDMEGLIKPEDQTRDNLTTVNSLTALVTRRVQERNEKQA